MSKDQANPLKYLCFEPKIRQQIGLLKNSTNQEIFDHIDELYDLIQYQILMIDSQRREIIAMKHEKAWSHYDKDVVGKIVEDRKNFRC